MLSWPKRILAIAAGLGLAALGFWAAAKWDLQIAQAVYQPMSPLSLLSESVGWWQLYLPIALLGFTTACIGRKKLHKKGGAAIGIGIMILLLGLAVMIYPACQYLRAREIPYTGFSWATLYFLAASMLCTGLIFCQHIRLGNLMRLQAFSLLGIGYMALDNLVVNIFKLIWQRTRFDDMLAQGSFDAFTSFYTIHGNGGNSFPSGHTAAAASMLLCVFFVLLFPSCKKEGEKLLFTAYVYTAVAGYGRMLAGRHFLSDVLFSILLATVLVAVLWSVRPLCRWLEQVNQKAERVQDEVPPRLPAEVRKKEKQLQKENRKKAAEEKRIKIKNKDKDARKKASRRKQKTAF